MTPTLSNQKYLTLPLRIIEPNACREPHMNCSRCTTGTLPIDDLYAGAAIVFGAECAVEYRIPVSAHLRVLVVGGHFLLH